MTKEGDMIDATSDARTANNTLRHQYRVLSDAEKQEMSAVKGGGEYLLGLVGELGESRELSLAKTKIEEAVFWACKHITN